MFTKRQWDDLIASIDGKKQKSVCGFTFSCVVILRLHLCFVSKEKSTKD